MRIALAALLFLVSSQQATAQDSNRQTQAGAIDLRVIFFNPGNGHTTSSFSRGARVGYRLIGSVPDTANQHVAQFSLVATIRTAGFAIPINLKDLLKNAPILNPESNASIDFQNQYVEEGSFKLPSQMRTGSVDLAATLEIEGIGSATVNKTLKITN